MKRISNSVALLSLALASFASAPTADALWNFRTSRKNMRSLSRSTTSLPTFEFKGCWADAPHRVLTHRVLQNEQPVPKLKCAETCKSDGYRFFGMQWTGECFCGGALPEWEGYKRLGGNAEGKDVGAPACNCDGRETNPGVQYGGWVNCVYLIDPPPMALPPLPKMDEEKKCADQDKFDVEMCQSHTCGKCAQKWCSETCMEIQETYPTCRCSNWAPSRKSFADGMDFSGAGGFGDKGDYSQHKAL